MDGNSIFCPYCGNEMKCTDRMPRYCSACGCEIRPTHTTVEDLVEIAIESKTRNPIRVFYDGVELMEMEKGVRYARVPRGRHSVRAVGELLFGSATGDVYEGTKVLISNGLLELKVRFLQRSGG